MKRLKIVENHIFYTVREYCVLLHNTFIRFKHTKTRGKQQVQPWKRFPWTSSKAKQQLSYYKSESLEIRPTDSLQGARGLTQLRLSSKNCQPPEPLPKSSNKTVCNFCNGQILLSQRNSLYTLLKLIMLMK